MLGFTNKNCLFSLACPDELLLHFCNFFWKKRLPQATMLLLHGPHANQFSTTSFLYFFIKLPRKVRSTCVAHALDTLAQGTHAIAPEKSHVRAICTMSPETRTTWFAADQSRIHLLPHIPMQMHPWVVSETCRSCHCGNALGLHSWYPWVLFFDWWAIAHVDPSLSPIQTRIWLDDFWTVEMLLRRPEDKARFANARHTNERARLHHFEDQKRLSGSFLIPSMSWVFYQQLQTDSSSRNQQCIPAEIDLRGIGQDKPDPNDTTLRPQNPHWLWSYSRNPRALKSIWVQCPQRDRRIRD